VLAQFKQIKTSQLNGEFTVFVPAWLASICANLPTAEEQTNRTTSSSPAARFFSAVPAKQQMRSSRIISTTTTGQRAPRSYSNSARDPLVLCNRPYHVLFYLLYLNVRPLTRLVPTK